MQYGERNIYLIIEFCAGGDLSAYIKKRGRVEGLEYVPSPGTAPTYYPHPPTGGLNEVVVRSFLRQLGECYLCLYSTRNV
jgi:serine/threonine-protein kinase ULK2